MQRSNSSRVVRVDFAYFPDLDLRLLELVLLHQLGDRFHLVGDFFLALLDFALVFSLIVEHRVTAAGLHAPQRGLGHFGLVMLDAQFRQPAQLVGFLRVELRQVYLLDIMVERIDGFILLLLFEHFMSGAQRFLAALP